MFGSVNEIIQFYHTFDRYANHSFEELYQHISPSVRNNNYHTFREGDQVYGFADWAFVSDIVLERFMQNGHLNTMDWMSGANLLYVDVVADHSVAKIMKWLRDHSVRTAGIGTKIYWARSTANKIKRITKQTTKEHWLWER